MDTDRTERGRRLLRLAGLVVAVVILLIVVMQLVGRTGLHEIPDHGAGPAPSTSAGLLGRVPPSGQHLREET